MAAKGLFDWLEEPGFAAAEYRRKTLRALLVSPIVLLGFTSLGDFDFGSAPLGTLLIYLCMAFQNFFFWQTVPVKAGETDIASHAARLLRVLGVRDSDDLSLAETLSQNRPTAPQNR